MPVVTRGVLTPQYFASLKKELNPDLPTEELMWADLSRAEIVTTLQISKVDAVKILLEINRQLVDGEAWIFIRPGLYEERECPDRDLLISMLNTNRPRFKDFDNEKFKVDDLAAEYGATDLAEKIAVINWCRSFIANKGVFIALQADVNTGVPFTMPPAHAAAMDRVANMPKPKAPTSPTPPSDGTKTTVNVSGDLTGRMSVEDGVIMTIGGKPYDFKNPDHRKLAEQKGYNPDTGIEI